jgi:hypothetical protein
MLTSKASKESYPIITTLIIAWMARFLYMLYMPSEVRAVDMLYWEKVADFLAAGINPYKETATQTITLLKWPPLWMQLIYLISRVSRALDIPFIQVLRIFLSGVDSLVIVALFRLIRQVDPKARGLLPVLLGIAVNPTIILLTCQHGNFDVIVALCAILFVSNLIQYYRSQDEVDWLAACLFLGLGILAKTVPLVLCPMLVGGWRRVAGRTRLVGAALLLGPVVLGMSIIYVLGPEDVAVNVLAYRSAAGFFGISGLLSLAGGESLIGWSKLLFYLLLAGAGIWTTSLFWRRERVTAGQIILCAAMFLAAIPGIGPGYSPQYLYWFLPLLVAVALAGNVRLKWVAWGFIVVAAVTCLVEYAIFPSQGAYLLNLLKDAHSAATRPLALRLGWWISPPGQTLIRLPLFIAFVVLLVTGCRMLIEDFCSATNTNEPAGGGKPQPEELAITSRSQAPGECDH